MNRDNIDTQAIIDRIKNADDPVAEAKKARAEIGELTDTEQLIHDASIHVVKQFGEAVSDAAQVYGLALDVEHNQLTAMIALAALGLAVPTAVSYGMPDYAASKDKLDRLMIVAGLQIRSPNLYGDKS